jgi:hypothetical protein
MLTMYRLAMDVSTFTSDCGAIQIPVSATSWCRLATGRSALLHLIQRLPRPHAATALLPAYVAEGVIQPFLTAGFKVLFYRLTRDLKPVNGDLATLLDRVDGVAVVVLIHYFGYPAHSPELTSVLAAYRPVVIDDCAHAPFTTTSEGKPLAEHAELALYSLNKFLPVVDGAILISQRADIDLSLNEEGMSELPDEAQQAYQNHLRAGLDLFNSVDPAQARGFLEKLGEFYERYYAVVNRDLSPFCQSARSRQVEEAFPYCELIQKRLLNSRVVYEGLKSSVFSLIYPALLPGVVPWCIPARVPAQRRTEILDRLFGQGILLSTLQNKWDFIPAGQRNRFEVEAAFLEEHVLIPISEFITPPSMWDMVKRLNNI